MSNSTRPGSYDERLVVPLEASRRGAHRARVNPLLAVLPLLAVVIVVAAVIGVAYTLFLKQSNQDSGSSVATGPSATATTPATSAPAASSPAASQPSASAGSATSSTTAATAKVDKTVAFKVYNGSSPVIPGIAGRGQAKLAAAGFTAGTVMAGTASTPVAETTVYYATADQAATAKAMVKALGTGIARHSAAKAGSGIVVVMGSDFGH
jgi:hypothetical protein